MDAYKALSLMRKYAKCPQCGNENVGNGEGVLDVNNENFVRSCKCGWKVEIKDGECG